MSKKIVIAGFGFMGQTHALNICRNPELSLAGIVDAVSPAQLLKRSSGNLNIDMVTEDMVKDVPHFTKLSDALAQAKPDAVVVATPTMLHYELGKQTLEAGCALFLEKPMCLDVALGEELVALAKAKGVVFMAGHCVRFTPDFLILKDAVESGKYGAIQYLHMSRYAGVPGWGCWRDPEVSAKSGGAMFDMAIHDTDCARSLFGDPDELSMMPYLRDRFGLMVVDSIWKYNNGPIVRIEAGFLEPSSLPFHKDFTAVFDKATLYSDMKGLWLCQGNELTQLDNSGEDCYAAEMNAFAKYLVAGKMPMECSGADALATIKICTRMFNFKD